MESVESYHAERISLPLILGSYEDIRYSRSVVAVERLPHLTDSLFTPHTQILWIEGRNLMSDDGIWMPYEMVHLDYTLPLPTGHGCFVPSSNGLASGNHIFEAMSHGICEVVERDATTLWHLLDSDEQEQTRVDLSSVTDPSCRELLEKYRNAGVLVAVWETTSDVGIPSFLCRVLQEAPPPYHDYRPASGMGCHPARGRAVACPHRGRPEQAHLHLGRPRRSLAFRLRQLPRSRDAQDLALLHGVELGRPPLRPDSQPPRRDLRGRHRPGSSAASGRSASTRWSPST